MWVREELLYTKVKSLTLHFEMVSVSYQWKMNWLLLHIPITLLQLDVFGGYVIGKSIL